MNRHKLEEFRMHVSHALCVPVEYVIASGIEATNSILVTFMVPEGYANILSDLSCKDKEYLGSRGVDAIWYQGHLVSCIDIELSGDEESLTKDEEVKILLDHKSKLDEEVEGLQMEVLKLQKAVRDCQRKNEQIAVNAREHIAITTARLIQQYLGNKYTPKELSLKEIASTNALRYFSHLLKKMEKLGYDTNLIRHLLEANQLVVMSRHWTDNQWIQTQQQQLIIRMQKEVDILKYERDKVNFYLQAGISKPVLTRAENIFLHNFLESAAPPPLVQTETKVHVELEEQVDAANHVHILLEIFNMWENTLKPQERSMLMNKFIPDARERKKFEESKALLLMYLWLKHSREEPGLQFDEWKIRILTAIHRVDLCKIWTKKSDMVVRAYTEPPVNAQNSIPDRTKKSKKKQKQENGRRQINNESTRSIPISDTSQDKLQHIEEMLQKNLRLTERLAQGVFNRSDIHSFPQKSDSDVLFDFSACKSKFFLKSLR